MTREDAELLLAQLTATWARVPWPPPTLAVYRAVFERMGRVDWAEKILAAAAVTFEWPPSVAHLDQEYRARERRWQMENWRGRELEQPYLSRDENLERIGDLLQRFWPEEPAA